MSDSDYQYYIGYFEGKRSDNLEKSKLGLLDNKELCWYGRLLKENEVIFKGSKYHDKNGNRAMCDIGLVRNQNNIGLGY